MPKINSSELEALVTLNAVDGFGSIRSKKLLKFFGSAVGVFSADRIQLSSCGVFTPVLMQRFLEIKKRFNAKKEIELAKKNNIKILTIHDSAYPELLKEIYDPPLVLYVKGNFEPCDCNAIGVVGSRGASFYGLSCAKEFSHYLSKAGITIVSGMARGIDTSAHRAALDAGGRTIACLGSGLLNIYPPENEMLFEEISENGAVISEFPLDTEPLAQNFPVRNRVISGLSRGVLVVEANQKSGALITARFALEQSREVFAIPGKLSSDTSRGTNDLIKQGAKMVTRPEEILEDLRFNFEPANLIEKELSGGAGYALASEELKVVNILDDEPKCVDDISVLTGIKAQDLLVILTHLELKNIVKRLTGQTFVRAY